MKYQVSSRLWSYVMGSNEGKILGDFDTLEDAQDFIKKTHDNEKEKNIKRMWLTGECLSFLVQESKTKFSCEYRVQGLRGPLAKKVFEIVKV